MCNWRGYTVSVALTYLKKELPSTTSYYSEGWYNLLPSKCETVQIKDAITSSIFFYQRDTQLVHEGKFCIDKYSNFSISNSNNESWCRKQMVSANLMATECIVGDGQVNFLQ